jgi:hypothetical protein
MTAGARGRDGYPRGVSVFRIAELIAGLRSWADGVAAVDVSEASGRIWLFPHRAGAAIHLVVDGDECDVYAGLTFHVTLLASGEGDQANVIDCITAIATGRAFEYYDFDDPRAHGRGDGAAGESFTGTRLSMTGGDVDRLQRRAITAWQDASVLRA